MIDVPMIDRALAGALGAEVEQSNLKTLEIVGARGPRGVPRYSVLVIRDQRIEPADLMRVGGRFGEPCHYPVRHRHRRLSLHLRGGEGGEETINFGGNWHSDTTYLPQPPLATLLYALETPATAATRCSPAPRGV